jgi:uncharacterized protein rv3789/MT3897
MSKIDIEISRFLVAGLSAVGVDFFVYYIMLNFLNHNLSKAISFILGTVSAFVINKYWTFEKLQKSNSEIWKFALLYLCTLGINISTNKIVLDYTNITIFAFLIATGISAVLNFIGQKFWVFK